MNTVKRLLLALVVCFLAGGCGVSDIDDPCDGQEGLFIETGRDSYQVGEEATLTVKNCTSYSTAFFGSDGPHYRLQKDINGTWKNVSGQTGMAGYRQEFDGAVEKISLPIELDEEDTEEASGTYRFELFIESNRSGGDFDLLPDEVRRSNTFKVTE